MKKQVIAVTLCAAMVAGLTGCGSKKISNEYITISQYKGLEVDKVSTEVTDDDVTSYIDSQLQSQGTDVVETPDRAAQSGDNVSLDYAAVDDAGNPIEGTSATNATLELGSGNFIAGWEDQCVGQPFNQEIKFDLAFPEDYNTTELAGTNAHWTVTMHGVVTGTDVPELTDEIVPQLSTTSKTVAEYKKEVKKTLEEQSDSSAQTTLESEVWDAIIAKTEVKKYPQDDIDELLENYKKYYEDMAKSYNMSYDDFLGYYGMSKDDFENQMEESAKQQVTRQLITELVLKKARINISDKDYQKKYEEYAKQYGYEDVDAFLEAATEETAKQMVEEQYAVDYLVENCKQVEPKKEETTDETTDEGAATTDQGEVTTDQGAATTDEGAATTDESAATTDEGAAQ